MKKLPTTDELINNFTNIPRKQLLAWWRSKGVKWDKKKLTNKNAYKFFLWLYSSNFTVSEKIFFIEILRQYGNESIANIDLSRHNISPSSIKVYRNKRTNRNIITIYNNLSLDIRRYVLSYFMKRLDALNTLNKNQSPTNIDTHKKSYESALLAYKCILGYPLCDSNVFNYEKAEACLELGIFCQTEERHTESYDYFLEAIEYCELLYLGGDCTDFSYAPDINEIYSYACYHLGCWYFNAGVLGEAIELLRRSTSIVFINYSLGCIESATCLARTTSLLIVCHQYEQKESNLTTALFNYSLNLLNKKEHKNNPEIDKARAILLLNLGTLLASNSDDIAAIDKLALSLDLFRKYLNSEDSDTWHGYALAALNIGNSFITLNRYPEAIEALQEAQKAYDNEILFPSLTISEQRCRLYALYSELFSLMDTPLSWAKEKGKTLIWLLDLAPEQGNAIHRRKWQSMLKNFALFHANWLSYAIKAKAFEEIPRILFTIQGRELVAELMDQLIYENDSNIPNQVRKFSRLRQLVREQIQGRQAQAPGGGIIIPLAHHDRPLSSLRLEEKKAIEEYHKVHLEMNMVREEAAQQPGFEALYLPFDSFNLNTIQKNVSASQALLLLIDFEGTNGILLITKTGAPQWLAIDAIDELARRTDHLAHSNPRGLQGYRRNTSDGEQSVDVGQVMSPEERQRFWPNMVKDVKEQIWQPLAEYLPSHITELIVLPQGPLHQLPIECGKPEGLSLRFYPGLIFYALENGLIKKNKPEAGPVEDTCSVGLLYYDHRDDKKKISAWGVMGDKQHSQAL